MQAHPFSPPGRRAALERMAREHFDLLVVGGGITGAGLARDAVLRGLNVALVEKEDFAFGTSSRSTKLVHGGIRYLSQGDVGLVRESARERKALLAIAPHLVHPLSFVYPLYKGESLTKLRAGFFLFDKLAGVTEEEAHRVLDRDEVRARAPHVREPVKGGVAYHEYITDDARLTLENALSAALRGAAVANHAAAEGLIQAEDRVQGARVRDRLGGGTLEVRARVVVNATGVWGERTLVEMGHPPEKHLLPSKGIHLLFRADRIPIDGALAIKSPSGREGFAIRRWDYVYVGTSDVPFEGELDRPTADEEAFDDVLRLARESLPDLDLQRRDVVAVWAGLRPLIAEPGKSTRDTSRHDEIWETSPGLVTIAGGKLTTYRRMAQRILAHVAPALGREPGPDRTLEVPLPYAEAGEAGWPALRDALAGRLAQHGVGPRAVERLTWLYGTALRDLLAYAEEDPAWLTPLPGSDAVRGEVRLAVEREMAATLEDFMDRRSALLIFSDDHGLAAADETARIMADRLGWDEARRQAELSAYRRLAAAHDVRPDRGA